jgi:hypothetical protein
VYSKFGVGLHRGVQIRAAVLSVVWYEGEMSSLTLSEDHKLKILEVSLLRGNIYS